MFQSYHINQITKPEPCRKMSKAIWSGKMANFKNHLQNFKQTLKYNNNYHRNDMAAVQEASMTIFNLFLINLITVLRWYYPFLIKWKCSWEIYSRKILISDNIYVYYPLWRETMFQRTNQPSQLLCRTLMFISQQLNFLSLVGRSSWSVFCSCSTKVGDFYANICGQKLQ